MKDILSPMEREELTSREDETERRLQAEIDRDMARGIAMAKVWDSFFDSLLGGKR
jgi:hypothetical protein